MGEPDTDSTANRDGSNRASDPDGFSLEQTFDSSHGAVAYDVFGSGEPVVLIHGTPSSSYLWRKVLAELRSDWEIYLFDLVGYGQSAQMEGQDVSAKAHGEVFSELLDFWDLREVNVVGHDYGATTALRAHLIHDHEYRRMALMDGVVKAPWVTPFSTLVRENIEVFQQVPSHIHRQLLIGHFRSAIHRDMSEDELEPYLEPWLGETGQAAYYRQVAQFDERYTDEIEPLYSSIDTPTLVGWGEHDGWLDFEVGEWLAEQIPAAEFRSIPDAGHFVPEDNPERVAGVIDEFFG